MRQTTFVSSFRESNSFQNRSSSTIMKTLFFDQDHSTKIRSQSIHLINENKTKNQNAKPMILLRMGHLLAKKLKKHSYFFFCRLENHHTRKKSVKEPVSSKKKENTNEGSKKNQLVEQGCKKLFQFCAVFSSKENLLQTFLKVKKYSKEIRKTEPLFRVLQTIKNAQKYEFFRKFRQIEKGCLKIQILNQSIENCLRNKKQVAFRTIKQKKINKLQKNVFPAFIEESEQFEETQNRKCKIITRLRTSRQKTIGSKNKKTICEKKLKSQHQRSEIRLNKRTKILTRLSQEDEKIIIKNINEFQFRTNHHPRLHNDVIKEELPDLYDNFGVFEGIQQIIYNQIVEIEEKQSTRKRSKNSDVLEDVKEEFQQRKNRFESLQQKYRTQINKNYEQNLLNADVLSIIHEIESIREKDEESIQCKKTKDIKLMLKQNSMRKSCQSSGKKLEMKEYRSERRKTKSKTKDERKKIGKQNDRKVKENGGIVNEKERKKPKKYSSKLNDYLSKVENRSSFQNYKITWKHI